ncbi:caspase family protein [Nitrospira sp. Kam-Ns4a]
MSAPATGRFPLSRRSVRLLALTLLSPLASGCMEGFSPVTLVHGDPAVQVTVRTDPPGAKIVIDGKEIGTSPVSFRDPSGPQKTFTVEIKKEGYEPVTRVMTRTWDSARLTYRLDPVYFYTLTPLPGTQEALTASKKGGAKPAVPPASMKVSDVDDVPKPRPGVKGRDAVALVIGISQYRDESIPQVRYARRDAEIMAAYLESVAGVSRSKMKVLLDEGATSSDLAAYVEEWLPRQVKPDTTVFVYYAGHGMPNLSNGKAFLVPYDGHPDFTSKLYPLDRLYEKLDSLPSKQVVVMLDSCFSGATGRSVLPSGARPMGLVMDMGATVKKAVVLSAASGTQISSDYDDQGHGLFTYFLLKGLRGEADTDGNGTIQVEELYDFVRDQVTKVASEKLNRDQTPLILPTPDSLGPKGKIQITRAAQ